MQYVVLSEKKWNKELVSSLNDIYIADNIILIDNKNDFNIKNIELLNPSFIFIPHWSHIIPKKIFNKFECIVFHMTDLPYGRGGSPLQNLIVSNHTKTKISALKVQKEIDAGPIYLKKELALFGTAEEIFIRANSIIEEMIIEIINKKLTPKNQVGEPTFFKRRTPNMSNIENIEDLTSLFNQIRMLDAEEYPKAYFENEHFKFEFTRASLKADKTIIADVRIIKK